MKKFFGISVVCIFTMLLFVVTFTYADWPPNETIVAGYAQLNDSTSYKFRSDGGGTYTDVHISGEPGEKAELAFNKKGALDGILLYLGKPDNISFPTSPLGEPPYYCSSRKSNFWFDILDGTKTAQYYSNKAALDILVWQSDKITRRGSLVNGKYYLNDNSVRLGIRRWLDVSGSIVHDIIFTIEPSNTPCSGCGTNAVTQTAIDGFYIDDTDTDYRDYKEIGTSVCDLVIYRISYDSDFSFVKAKSKKNTWTISGNGSAHLGVVLNSDGSTVRLVDYTNLPFQVTVSTTSGFTAPPKSQTSTTLWGEIKSQ